MLGELAKGREDFVGGAAGPGLQVLHGIQGRLVPGAAGAADAVGDDPDVEVALMGVGEGVVHADVGQTSDEHQRRGPQTAQHDLELGAEEPGVPTLDDVELVLPRGELQGGALRTLDAVPALGPVELAAEVDPAAPVHLLEEDDRHPGGSRGVDQQPGPAHPLGVARHDLDAHVGRGQRPALLDVDHDEHRRAHDQRLPRHRRLPNRCGRPGPDRYRPSARPRSPAR